MHLNCSVHSIYHYLYQHWVLLEDAILEIKNREGRVDKVEDKKQNKKGKVRIVVEYIVAFLSHSQEH